MPRLLICYVLLCLLLVACASSGDEVLFQETFAAGEMGNWLVEGDALAQTAVLNEQLLITIDAPNLVQFSTLQTPSFADFVLEVDASQIAGDVESSFGVLFRMQNPTQFYRFDITGNGLYMIERHNADNTWTQLLPDWTTTPAINQGLNSTNQLKVVAVGASLSFYVNGILLQEIQDVTYGAGTIALDAGTFGRSGLQVVFDNVKVTQP